jgi:hypothetical protein
MKRLLVIGAAVVVLVLAATASARVIELGSKAATVRPTCPTGCEAVARLTGYQGRSGSVRNPFVITRAGYIVAFSIKLGRPTRAQIGFFNENYGGSRVRLAILRRGRTLRTRRIHRLVRQSRVFRLRPYFGSTPTFVLNPPLRVKRTHRVAITVPTWAPALATGLRGTNWWRASRPSRRCLNVTQRVAHQRRVRMRYGCDYFKARLTYTATFVPDNRRR